MDTTSPEHRRGAADMAPSGNPRIQVEVATLVLRSGVRVDDSPLRERLDRARRDFDAVVVDWGDPYHRWDLPGDRVVVPVGSLPAETLGVPPAHHRMWNWLTEEYLRFAVAHPSAESIAYDALCQTNSDWLDSLSEEEFDRWEEENVPDESPQRSAFLSEVAERAYSMWGQTWTDHAGQWTAWYDSMNETSDADSLLARTPREAADELLSYQHMLPNDTAAWARIVCVMNRQEALPDHLCALFGGVRAELRQRGLRLAETVIPETDAVRRRRPVTSQGELEPLPTQVLERYEALATELVH